MSRKPPVVHTASGKWKASQLWGGVRMAPGQPWPAPTSRVMPVSGAYARQSRAEGGKVLPQALSCSSSCFSVAPTSRIKSWFTGKNFKWNYKFEASLPAAAPNIFTQCCFPGRSQTAPTTWHLDSGPSRWTWSDIFKPPEVQVILLSSATLCGACQGYGTVSFFVALLNNLPLESEVPEEHSSSKWPSCKSHCVLQHYTLKALLYCPNPMPVLEGRGSAGSSNTALWWQWPEEGGRCHHPSPAKYHSEMYTLDCHCKTKARQVQKPMCAKRTYVSTRYRECSWSTKAEKQHHRSGLWVSWKGSTTNSIMNSAGDLNKTPEKELLQYPTPLNKINTNIIQKDIFHKNSLVFLYYAV